MESEIDSDQKLKNIQTGESVNKKEVMQFVESQITLIKKELNNLTNNGQNVKDIFTNNYYVNDSMQDRAIIAEINAKEKASNNNDIGAIIDYHEEYIDN
jgi:hypothetical protein